MVYRSGFGDVRRRNKVQAQYVSSAIGFKRNRFQAQYVSSAIGFKWMRHITVSILHNRHLVSISRSNKSTLFSLFSLISSSSSLVFVTTSFITNNRMFSCISSYIKSFFYALFLELGSLFFGLGLLTLVMGFLVVGDFDSICRHFDLLYAFITSFPVNVWLWVDTIVWEDHLGCMATYKSTLTSIGILRYDR